MASGWAPDRNPIELADGTLICERHRQIICYICCCDYSFVQELRNEEEQAAEDAGNEGLRAFSQAHFGDELGHSADFLYSAGATPRHPTAMNSSVSRDGSEIPFASGSIPSMTKFVPPRSTDSPSMIFQGAHRFIRRTNPHEILIYTDGACLSNGLANPRGGCGLIVSPTHKVNFRLENTGPTDEPHPQTSNRAELRAVIAALQHRYWQGDCMGAWTRLVIATDSEYVVLGATERIRGWNTRGRRTNAGKPVKNQDLWKKLIHEIQKLDEPQTFMQPPHGTSVSFWRIPREWNEDADAEAKKGAELEDVQRYTEILGVMI
ncbi:8c48b181-f435-4bf8-ae0d-39208a787be9 [Sclerotinia trifoliorum]|uniref:ribonuclease H n=1 Tax=Sclerotinia trifoliorum TaxID=28548 RepID=A0A8H2W411_9HELO|nr:8c48b181-f435-4bf8-ae0d-39208a787be9 [Sclerotinia trifoliorum]